MRLLLAKSLARVTGDAERLSSNTQVVDGPAFESITKGALKSATMGAHYIVA